VFVFHSKLVFRIKGWWEIGCQLNYRFSQQLVSELGCGEMQSLKFGVERFDGRMNFGLWQIQVKDILIQSGLHKTLRGIPTSGSSDGAAKSGTSDIDWEDLDLKAASTIRLCLAKNVLANVQGMSTAKELWEKLEEMYQTKGISNRVYLKEQFHTLRMAEGTTISDHLSVLNGIVSELETLGVKMDDEDKALRLILSLPSSYEHMKPILIHGKEKILFSEVTSKLLSEERRLNGGQNSTPENSALVVANKKKKNPIKGNIVCWGCGQSGHLKRNCPKRGACSADCSKDANIVSLVTEREDDFF
jgi:hypothetical protein